MSVYCNDIPHTFCRCFLWYSIYVVKLDRHTSECILNATYIQQHTYTCYGNKHPSQVFKDSESKQFHSTLHYDILSQHHIQNIKLAISSIYRSLGNCYNHCGCRKTINSCGQIIFNEFKIPDYTYEKVWQASDSVERLWLELCIGLHRYLWRCAFLFINTVARKYIKYTLPSKQK